MVTSQTPTCGMTEGDGVHHHSEENGCYQTENVLSCGQEASEGHQHTDACKERVCVCQMEEHTHSLACYSDTSADVEDASVWNRTVSSVTLTGDWGEDLAAIAATQVGYTESEKNYAVMEDQTTKNGYTRYGAWAGDAYRDNWSAQFVNFCLSYAGIPSSAIAQKNDCGQWNTTTTDADGNEYTAKTGDLIILDLDQDGAADHAGIVTKTTDGSVTAIVGDLDQAVKTDTYTTSDSTIIGYVAMPEKPTATPIPTSEVTEAPEETPTLTPEVTEVPEETPTPTPEVTEVPEETPTPTPEVTQVPEETPTPTPEVTEVPEVTPTPEQTLVQSTLTVQMYSDSTYETAADENEITITVSGNLPENASVKAYPVENVTLEGEVLCAWDISIYDAQGNLWEPEEGNNISVEFHVPELTEQEDAEYSIYYIPDEGTGEEPEQIASQVNGNVISFEAEHFSVYVAMRMARGASTEQGIDFKTYIENVTFEYKKSESNSWETADNEKLNKNDSIRFGINYKLTQGALGENNVIYYNLPDQLKNFIHNGEVLDQSGNGVGTYEIKNGKLVITFNEDFAKKNATSDITGWVKLDGTASDIKEEGSTSTNIKFKEEVEYTVYFEDDVNAKGDLSVRKEATEVNQINGTIKYKITIYSEHGTNEDVTVEDIMTNIIYDASSGGGLQITNKSGQSVKLDDIQLNTSKTGEISCTLPKMNAKDLYTITYIAKLPENAAYTVTATNKVTATSKRSDDTEIRSEHEISTDFQNKVKKEGKLSDDGNSITWTIIINERNKDLGGWILRDVLDGTEYNQTVNINPPVKGEGDKLTSQITLPYTFKQGDNQTYTITYTTVCNQNSANVKNTATLTPPNNDGNNKSESSGEISVDVPNKYEKTGTGTESNSDGTITLKWKATITARTDIDSWTWTDDVSNKNPAQWFTQAQVDTLKERV